MALSSGSSWWTTPPSCAPWRRICSRPSGRRHRELGQEAIHLLDGGARFDLILMDCRMPGMSGSEYHARSSRRGRAQREDCGHVCAHDG